VGFFHAQKSKPQTHLELKATVSHFFQNRLARMSITIKSVGARELYVSDSSSVRSAVLEAVAKKADLREAYLWGADLRGANLREADLWGADLRGANLREADLWGADLRGADLRGADLWGADLREAYLRGAYLRGADLRGATGERLRGAYWGSDCGERTAGSLPAGSRPAGSQPAGSLPVGSRPA
jgi:uncharacterized protein YjbI with pentapeptide repeats